MVVVLRGGEFFTCRFCCDLRDEAESCLSLTAVFGYLPSFAICLMAPHLGSVSLLLAALDFQPLSASMS